jgi:hypothetical protein
VHAIVRATRIVRALLAWRSARALSLSLSLSLVVVKLEFRNYAAVI